MPTSSSESDLTPDQRFRQIAAILARGVRRRRQLKRRYESCEPETSVEDVAVRSKYSADMFSPDISPLTELTESESRPVDFGHNYVDAVRFPLNNQHR